jgi:formylglycine-generating enzyme required for sulfatase activity
LLSLLRARILKKSTRRNQMSFVAKIIIPKIVLALSLTGILGITRAIAAQPVIKDCEQCPEMIVVPAGKFTMGTNGEDGREDDEVPARTVTIVQPFALGKYEVTFDEWDACVASGACEKAADESWGRVRRPVINVNLAQANAYAKWLSAKTGKQYALPSEAQWEYAAQAGGSQGAPWAGDKTRACEHANVYDALAKAKLMFDWAVFPCTDGFTETAPVGSFAANAFGLHDMLGNVWEWVADCYRPSYAEAPADGSAVTADTCMKHLSRGGSWNIFPAWVRSGYRYGLKGELRASNLGLRVMRVVN